MVVRAEQRWLGDAPTRVNLGELMYVARSWTETRPYVSSRVGAELDAVPDPDRLVLTACSPGQVTWTSQTLELTTGHTFIRTSEE